MSVALDSSRWQDLRDAYGRADHIPALIRAIQAEAEPDYSDGGVWFEVYSALYHQHSVYSATYAAMPHLARVAESGTTSQRLAVLCLAGEMCLCSGRVGEFPDDLISDFQAAIREIKGHSLKIIRDAAQKGILRAPEASWGSGQVLSAFGGLHFPTSGYVAQLGYMVIEGWRVESKCPACDETSLVRFDDQGIVTRQLSSGGHEIADFVQSFPVDRSAYGRLIAAGNTILAIRQADWPVQDLPVVLAALAKELGEEILAVRILDLGSRVACAYCGQMFELSKTLRPLF